MRECEFLGKCKFLGETLKKMPSASDMLRKMYCQWRYKKCARYKVALKLGPEKIPTDLFPGDTARADMILANINQSS